MSTRRSRMVAEIREVKKKHKLDLMRRFPAWADPRTKPPGWFDDIQTVPEPLSFGRRPTDAELVAFKQGILEERREEEEYRLKSLMGTKDKPEHLTDAAREIHADRKNPKRGVSRTEGEEP